MTDELWGVLTILCLAFVQNISFSVVSRSRNRNNMTYHLIAAFFSNGIWFLTFRELVRADMTFILFVPYVVGTISGSLSGVKVSMWIESWIGAEADGHVKKINVEELEARVAFLESGHTPECNGVGE